MSDELEKKYQSLITDLKILERQNKKVEYRAISKELEKIRERRHLGIIGEKNKDRERYKQLLNWVDENYDGTIESVDNIVGKFTQKEKTQGEER